MATGDALDLNQLATRRRRDDDDSTTDPGSGPDGGRKIKRLQVAKACARCKRLQKGCSDARPCRRCVAAGLEAECLANDTPEHPGRRSHGLPASPVAMSLLAHSPDFASAWHLAQSPTSTPAAPHAHGPFVRKTDLLPALVTDGCVQRFFARLSPTIPILPPEFVVELRTRSDSVEGDTLAYGLTAAICAMVLLQVEQPDAHAFEGIITHTNAAYGTLIFEEASAVYHSLPVRSNPSLERVLFSFFLYTCNAALFHHSQAFFFLREATTMFILLKINPDDETAADMTTRLFWVLLVTERSHAIRYRRPITLQITADTPDPDPETSDGGFRSLVALFRPLDTSFISLLNQETVSLPPTPAALAQVETSISQALDDAVELHDTQKANLRITQLWLSVILWKVLLRLGLLSSSGSSPAFSYHHPLQVAKDLVLSTRDLSIDCIKIHGVGITEKLFDVACAVVDVLASLPVAETGRGPGGLHPEGNLRYVRSLISKLPGGSSTYDRLLDKHIQQNLPSFDG
ncbi:hypothetical protein GQ53DRAFT_754765 [Thozetella sp. PMI_491]|nr:hypothetical protein GQ53DRAFT_754765 [Thozetella sp. PMI_491]